MTETEETSTTSLSLSASATTSPRVGKGLFQFEHTPPSDAAYQQQNLNLRSIKDNERRYALEQLQQCDNLREGEVPLFIGMVKRTRLPETKKQKPTRRVLVIGKYRILSIVRKKLGGHKISRNFHLLELIEINQQERDKASFTFVAANDKKQRLAGIVLYGAAVPEIIYCLRIAYLRITCGFPTDYGFTLRAPSALLLPLDAQYTQMDPEVVGPANGFIETYLAQCNYLGVEPNNQLVQFICDLWAKHITELNLTLCPGFEPKSAVSFHLEPIIGALTHNTYFKSITIEDVARKEALHAVIMALRFNQTLTKITLAYLPDLSAENCMELRNAVINNPHIKIQMLDFQGTSISTKGAAHLATALEALPHSLHTLIISESNIGTKGMQEVIMALCKNFGMSLGLQVLDLSQNKLDEGCSKWLETWLEKSGEHSHLRKLMMSRCGMMDLTFIAKPLRQLNRLVELDISYNKVDDGITQLIRVALEDTTTLENLKLEHCGLSGYNAAAILTALGTNKKLQTTKLNIADNELPDTDADMLANAVKKTLNLHTLNISKNKLKYAGLIQIVDALRMAVLPKIHTLVLDNSVDLAKHLNGTAVAEALIALINPPDSTIRVLSIAGAFNKAVVPLLERLSSKSPLEEFDISNNKIGDSGAVALSEMLRDNTSLKVLKCDNNGITLTGWLSFLSLFMYNHTLQWMDHPWQDYARVYASYANSPQGERKRQKLRETLLSIQRAIESNNVSFRGWFPVEDAMDPPALARTDPAPSDVTPKYAVPPELDEFARSVKMQESEARKRRANGSMIVNPRASSGNVSLTSRTMRKEKESWEVAAPAQEPTKDAAMEGPLTILSNVVKSWKARYFVLKTDNVLYYWKSPQHVAKKSNGRVPLTGAKVMPLAQEGITKAYCIEVHTDVRTYFLCAGDKDEMDRWLVALKKAAAVDDVGPEKHPTTISVGAQNLTDSWTSSSSTPSDAKVAPAPAQSQPTLGKSGKTQDDGAPAPPLPSRDDNDDSDEYVGKGKEIERDLPPAPSAPPMSPPQPPQPEPFPAIHFPSPSASTMTPPARLLPSTAPLYPPAAFYAPPPASAPPASPAPTYAPLPPAAPPPPPVNVAKAYIPRALSRAKEVHAPAEESPRAGEASFAGALSNQVSTAISLRRSALKEDDYVSDDDSSDWDSEGDD